MVRRIVLIGLALSLSMPALAGQTSREREAVGRTSVQPASERRMVPPGRKVWDHPDEPGAWLPWEITCTPVEAAAQQAWEKQLRAIAAMIRACPVFAEIRGYYPMITGCVQRSGIPAEPHNASLALLIWPPVTVERTPKGEPKLRDVWRYNGLGGLWININSFGDVTHDWPTYQDKAGRFHELPEAREEFKGFSVLGRLVYLTPVNKPPVYAPITRERALHWILDQLQGQAIADASLLESARRQYEEFISPAGQARRQKAIDEAAASQQKPENQALVRRQAEAIDRRREQDLKAAIVPKPGGPQARTAQHVTELEARLAAMTPEERRKPAWYKPLPGEERWPDYGEIVEVGTAGARPLVVANGEFFDRALPKTAMQLVRTRVIASCVEGDADPAIQRVCQAVVGQMNWKAVQDMLR
jgi:hypothetical protein